MQIFADETYVYLFSWFFDETQWIFIIDNNNDNIRLKYQTLGFDNYYSSGQMLITNSNEVYFLIAGISVSQEIHIT